MIEYTAREVVYLLGQPGIVWLDGWVLVPYAYVFPLGSTLDWSAGR